MLVAVVLFARQVKVCGRCMNMHLPRDAQVSACSGCSRQLADVPVLDSRVYTFVNTHPNVRMERRIDTMFSTFRADTYRSRPQHAKGRYVYPAYASRVS